MKTNTLPKRKLLRLPNFDYSQEFFYFITICTHNKTCLFGEVINYKIQLNPTGKMIHELFSGLPNIYKNITIDNLVVMPNHLHAIVALNSTDKNLSDIISGFKSFSTRKFFNEYKLPRVNNLPSKLWQKGFYDHVIRNEKSYLSIREYIENNPAQWHLDDYFRS